MKGFRSVYMVATCAGAAVCVDLHGVHRGEIERITTYDRTPVSAKYNLMKFCDPHIWCFNPNLNFFEINMDVPS